MRQTLLFVQLLVWLAIPATAQSPDAALRTAWWSDSPSPVASDAPAWVREVGELLAAAGSKNLRAARASAERLSFQGTGIERAWRAAAFAHLAEASTGDCRPILDAPLGRWENGCRAAGEGLKRALEAVPGFGPAVARLAEFAPYPEVWAKPVIELRHIDASLLDASLPSTLRRSLSRTAMLLALEVDSVNDVDSRIASTGAEWTDAERTWLRATTLALRGDGRRAVDSLGRAARAKDGEQSAWIARDIEWVGDSIEIREWKSLVGADERAAWLVHFWTARDERSARPTGSRWIEHVQRFRYAMAHYRSFADGQTLTRPLLHPDIGFKQTCTVLAAEGLTAHQRSGRLGHALLDMRGQTYMRHGEPTRRANIAGTGGIDSEAWFYQLPDAPLIAVFCRPQESLNEMIAQPLAFGGEYDDMCELAAFYCVLDALATLNRQSPWGAIAPERLRRLKDQGRAQYERLEYTDSHDQRFAKPLKAAMQVVGVPGPQPSVLSLAELRDIPATDGSLTLRWQVYVSTPDGRRVVEHDTTRSYAIGAQQSLTVALPVQAPPGRYTVTTVISTPDSAYGAAVRRADVEVLDDRSSAGISDLVMHDPRGRGVRGMIAGEAVYLAPSLLTGVSGRSLGLGFVARGLDGVPIRVTVAVRRLGAKPSDPSELTLSTTETPSSAWEWRSRTVALDRLDPGSYEVVLSVALPSGEVATRRQSLVLR